MSSDAVVLRLFLKAHFHTQVNDRTRALQTPWGTKSFCMCTCERMYAIWTLSLFWPSKSHNFRNAEILEWL